MRGRKAAAPPSSEEITNVRRSIDLIALTDAEIPGSPAATPTPALHSPLALSPFAYVRQAPRREPADPAPTVAPSSQCDYRSRSPTRCASTMHQVRPTDWRYPASPRVNRACTAADPGVETATESAEAAPARSPTYETSIRRSRAAS